MRYLPLNKTLKPLVPYKSSPELGMTNGLEYGDWVPEAAERGYGIGLLLDNSGLLIVDTDSRSVVGKRGLEVFPGWKIFELFCRENGLPGIPRTFTVRTRTPDHYHFYFRQSKAYPVHRTLIHSKIPDCDVKVSGYVVSYHTEGYDVVRDTEILEIPDEIAENLAAGTGSSGEPTVCGERAMSDEYASYILGWVQNARAGERNYTLHRVSRAFFYAGRTSPMDRNTLLQAAASCGMPDTEALRTVESAWKK
jgi:hypothetical protein